jgi:sugar-specific transcriptional regulator TrmB
MAKKPTITAKSASRAKAPAAITAEDLTKLPPGAKPAILKEPPEAPDGRLRRTAQALHDKAQDVVNEIDRMALVCPPVEGLRQALRQYRAALT